MNDEVLDRLRAALADRYTIERELGRGGMATVYLAEDLKHHRKVAIKALLPNLAATLGTDRFLREIEVIAKLEHPHVLTLIDSGDVEGLPYYVMPYVEGESLQTLLEKESRLSVEEAVRIAVEVADGLEYAHQHGVVHRDIKPANILLSGGHAVVADFGIATALEQAAVGRITETGISLGSPVYMSPEQAAGERDLDARTDIYSLGCVLYEMLTGESPFDDPSMQVVVTRKLLGEFRPAKDLYREVPPEVDAAVSKALSSTRADRFSSASEFAEALAAGTLGTPPPIAGPAKRKARRRAAALGSIAIIAIVGLSLALLRARAESRKVLWATQQLGEIERLAEAGHREDAYALAEEVEAIIPDDSLLAALWPKFAYFVSFRSDPAGADVARQPYDDPDAEWEYLGVTPLERVRFPWVVYRLRLEAEGYRPVELLPHALIGAAWRGVPPMDTVRLDTEATLPDGMVRVPGFVISNPLGEDEDTLVFRDYLMDRYEVSNKEYKRFVDAGGYRNRDYWTEPFFMDGRELTWEEGIAQFEDQTGRPGPSTWRLGTYPDGQADYPVGGVSWYEAAAYARFSGKELPTDEHWVWALRFYRETSWVLAPGSNLSTAGPRPVGESRAMNTFGIYDLLGNVREWCFNEVEGGRVTRGAAWNDPQFQGGNIVPQSPFDRSATNGVRLATYFDDDTTLAHVRNRIEWSPPRDYSVEVPASQAEYEVYRRLYSYDPTPLNSVVEASDTAEHWVRYKITFDAAYGGERAGVYLYVPREATPPFQTAIFWSGSPILDFTSIDQLSASGFDYVLRSGRAVAVPLLKGTFERDDSTFSITWARVYDYPESSYFRDMSIAWIKDVRRTLDYLETRDDVDSEKFAFHGISWGPAIAPIVLAVEPRVRAATLYVGGLVTWSGFYPLPEVDPFNFLPRVSVPVLMLNGRYDNVFPYETSQVPFFQLLGTAPEHKRHFVDETAHFVDRDDLIRETLDWLDRYLGVPE